MSLPVSCTHVTICQIPVNEVNVSYVFKMFQTFSNFLGDRPFFAGNDVTHPDFCLYEMLWYPCVNFTNILRAAFAPKPFRPKITNPNCKHIKGAQKRLYEKAACKMLVKLTPCH
jgi:hypothetical protein